MGRKVIYDNADSDSSDDERKKTVREERKIRTKKKKRKRDLTDLHQRLFKSKKNKETKIKGKLDKPRNSKRICNRILPRPLIGIYRNGAAGKEIRRSQTKLSSNDTNDARLQGNVLKLLQGYDSKSNIIVENNSEENCKESLLDSAIQNMLHPTPPGNECLSPVLGKVDGKKRCQKHDYVETVDPTNSVGLPQKSPENRKKTNPESFRYSALSRYQELCATVASENIEAHNSLDQLIADPLITVKKGLRSMYAEAFHSQFLRDMIKRGTLLNERENSQSSLQNDIPSESAYCPSDLLIHKETDKEENNSQEPENLFLAPEPGFCLNGKRNKVSKSHLLFDLSLLNGVNRPVEVENTIELEQMKKLSDLESDDDLTDFTSLDVNRASTSTCKDDSNTCFEDFIPAYLNNTEKAEKQDRNKHVLFFTNQAEISNDITIRKLTKNKTQHKQSMHSLNTAAKRYSGKHMLKASNQIKAKNLKHIPAILRRRNNAATINDQVNIFQESTNINDESQEELFHLPPKQNILFSSDLVKRNVDEKLKRLETTAAANAILNDIGTEDIEVQTCVIASPSLRNDEVLFIKNCPQIDSKQQLQNINANNIFPHNSKKNGNPAVQKTIMFTKKDSRNISHCLHLNSLISDGASESSNICVVRKNHPQQQEKSTRNVCTMHRNCQKTSASYYRPFHCSQNSDNSNHNSQTFKNSNVSQLENVQVRQEPAYEKVLLRKVQQHPKYENNKKCHDKDEKVCYVVLDRCKSFNTSSCSSDNRPTKMKNPRIQQNRRCCEEDISNVGILKGVQNLQLLPVEEREPQVRFTNSQCIGNTVVLEEQPIKYLAVENDSQAQRIPIYVQDNRHVATVDNVEVINPNVNYHVVSCPKESDQKIILVPAREQNNVVYLKQQDLKHSNISYEKCPHPKKVVLYRQGCSSNTQCVENSSNLCEIHVPKQNLIEIRNDKCEDVAINLQKADDSINWKKQRYRSSHEHSLVNDAYVRNQAVFYRK
ncbi:uncharacterized protein LOC143180063 [Calliopsis andreniformis]|uniref:uncharacterized protein LOC143180063 n=1 Tax=Calliopsis andreniformis TaxID=337506 RepID=UPI003FCC7DA2